MDAHARQRAAHARCAALDRGPSALVDRARHRLKKSCPALRWRSRRQRLPSGQRVAYPWWMQAMCDRSAIAVRSKLCKISGAQRATSPAETPLPVPTAREAIGRPLQASVRHITVLRTCSHGTVLIIFTVRSCFACSEAQNERACLLGLSRRLFYIVPEDRGRNPKLRPRGN